MPRRRQRTLPIDVGRRVRVWILLGGSFLSSHPAFAQCIMCRESLKSGGSDDLIRGFMFSTLLLTSVPLLIASAFAFAFYRAAQQRARQAASAVPEAGSEGEMIR